MTNNHLNQIADYIWSAISSKEGSEKTKEQQQSEIKEILLEEFKDVHKRARQSALNECVNLLKDIH